MEPKPELWKAEDLSKEKHGARELRRWAEQAKKLNELGVERIREFAARPALAGERIPEEVRTTETGNRSIPEWFACSIPFEAVARLILAREVFGPLIAIIRAKNLDEAIAIENASPYGNAAAVFTENGGFAKEVMERASAGMIGVNIGVPVPREPFPFGGWNDSKFGVCDITGKSSIEFWTQNKKTSMKWNPEAKTNWMS